MRSKTLNTTEIDWTSSLELLNRARKPSPTIQKLQDGGVHTLQDLLWILPLRIGPTPHERPFREAHLNQFFRGRGKVIHVEIKPAFGRRGKGNILLYNGYVILKDAHSNDTLSLRWFNLYPNQKKQIESLESIAFMGQVQEFKAQHQVINPQIIQENTDLSEYIAEYPTVNKVSGTHLKKILELIPERLWRNVPQSLPNLDYDRGMSLTEAFRVIHGRIPAQTFSPRLQEKAEERLIYEEFLLDQLRIRTRRKLIKRKAAPCWALSSQAKDILLKSLPFTLTSDQNKVFTDILKDMDSGHPMMRMIQGDVGCGKTIVAYLAAEVARDNGFQIALMCPTEALAQQHYLTFKELNPDIKLDIFLGSTKAKEKKQILDRLANGITQMVIGTHSLFQDTVRFSKLGLAIIDEQHKFGVEQRLRLVAKGEATHTLIMTATPIPRTLSLAQYGDLDISSIKVMPAGRKGIKTRITEQHNYDKYLDFIRARLKLGEQAYLVFPAIEESEVSDLQNVKDGLEKYSKQLQGFRVSMLHGQMKSDEKEAVIADFKARKSDVLISTSVIEVGINIPNATIMSIYNPERFGLSSLHQLRGRVGRGEKGGFCFLVLDRKLDPTGMERLKVIENNLDGFVIAEEDLKFRGEGDLFGVDQSGTITTKKLANFLTHTAILEKVIADLDRMDKETPELLTPWYESLAKDQKILDTI